MRKDVVRRKSAGTESVKRWRESRRFRPKIPPSPSVVREANEGPKGQPKREPREVTENRVHNVGENLYPLVL